MIADRLLSRVIGAQALSQAAFMAMVSAIPVLAFAAPGQSPALAGLLLGLWGGGAMAGGAIAYAIVTRVDHHRLATTAWALQAAPLWLLVWARTPPVAAIALAASGLGNGIRVPPVAAWIAQRLAARQRAEVLTAASTAVLCAGFLALLAIGPALKSHPGPVWTTIALLQTTAAGLWATTRPTLHHGKTLATTSQ